MNVLKAYVLYFRNRTNELETEKDPKKFPSAFGLLKCVAGQRHRFAFIANRTEARSAAQVGPLWRSGELHAFCLSFYLLFPYI